MKKIMFVCHGNICRSPMAEFIFKDMIRKKKKQGTFEISSSATSTEEIWGGVGNPIYPPAKAVLEAHNILFSERRATLLRKDDYDKYDLFVCMDNRNVEGIMRIFGNDKDEKVKLLMSYTKTGKNEIADPWYSGNFEETYNDIYVGCECLLKAMEGFGE